MQVVRLGQGAHWTVYAVCTPGGECPVLDLVTELDKKRGAKVLSDLREYVPNSTAQQWAAAEFSKPLVETEGLLEFRWTAKGGGTPRVLWFYQPGKLVVCSHGHNKKGTLPSEAIDAAADIKQQFIKATEGNEIVVVEYADYIAI
jgi:hypothetical protein